MKKLFFVLFVLCVATVFAETPENVSIAFNKFEEDTVFTYSYNINTRTKSENVFEKFDPTRGDGRCWQLISVNGQTPTEERLEQYYKTKANVNNEKSISFGSDDMHSFILVDETADSQTYSFKLNESKKNKMAKYLKCKLVITKEKPRVSQIEMYIEKPFSPMLSVKINEFKMKMIFHQMADTGANLVKSIKTVVKGKAFFIKEINENTYVEYSEYKLIE